MKILKYLSLITLLFIACTNERSTSSNEPFNNKVDGLWETLKGGHNGVGNLYLYDYKKDSTLNIYSYVIKVEEDSIKVLQEEKYSGNWSHRLDSVQIVIERCKKRNPDISKDWEHNNCSEDIAEITIPVNIREDGWYFEEVPAEYDYPRFVKPTGISKGLPLKD